MKLIDLLRIVPDLVFVRIHDKHGNLCYHDNTFPEDSKMLKSNVLSVYPAFSYYGECSIHVVLNVHINYLG